MNQWQNVEDKISLLANNDYQVSQLDGAESVKVESLLNIDTTVLVHGTVTNSFSQYSSITGYHIVTLGHAMSLMLYELVFIYSSYEH